METKVCNCCKKEFPKTEEYFFKQFKKRYNKKGLHITYYLDYICKKCQTEKSEIRRIKKRCKEMNCDISEYKENWVKQFIESKTKYKRNTTITKYHVDNITDTYIKRLLKNSKIPKEIIETKRLLITLKRELKNGK